VLDEIVTSASPRFAEVEAVFNVRGGMATTAVARSGNDPS
jgi:NADPH-dependent 7-cyano-7-deazaguanine reductase QueF